VTALAGSLDRITVAELRRRGGLKWTYAGPDVLGAFVAEMDFGTAPEVDAALREVIARQDFGYLPPATAQRMAEACAAWLADRHGWAVDPDRIPAAARRHQGPRSGDHPVLPPRQPGDPAHPGLHAVPVRAAAPRPGHHPGADGDVRGRPVLDTDGIDAAFRAGGHLLILCSPCNPVAACTPRPS